MMQIVYFSQKDQFLREIEAQEGKKEFICPSPSKADGLRSRLSAGTSMDVITIAKFTSNLIGTLWQDEELPAVKRKAELLLTFGILKNKYLPELGHEQFNQAYNLFSDLRSFTTNYDALSSVLDEQPEEIKKAVHLFWQILDLTGYSDEHGAYQQITEKLRSSEDQEDLHKTFIFWGFQHLNGQQVDLLKALAIRYNVIIPFPLALKNKLKRSDWVSWLKDSKLTEIDLPVIPATPRGKLVTINSREIALSLKDYLAEGDQIVLGVSKLTPLLINVIPTNEVNFKVPHSLVESEVLEIASEIKKFSGSSSELGLWLTDKMKSAKSLKFLRALQLYQEALNGISELTDEEVILDKFFIKLIVEVVSLNQPRTSYVPVSPNDMTMELKDMSSLEDVDRKRRVILCIDERFEDIQSLGQNYTESIQKALAALGPLKRNELELLHKQWEFEDLFSNADVRVFMGESTLKHSLIWKRMFSNIALENEGHKVSHVEKELIDPFKSLANKKFNGNLSASKFQTYLDCPRKFYFSFVEKIFPDVQLEKDFDPRVSGTIIHEIIECFFKEKVAEEGLRTLTTRIMEKYVKEKELVLPAEVYKQRELIFFHRALNGISFLRKLEHILNETIEWKIEERFSISEDYKLNGIIDCLAVTKNHVFLLDFKSTSSAAASNTDVVQYDAVQLWTYAKAAEKIIPDFKSKTVVLGYVVLDDSSESNLLTGDEELAKTIKEAKICSIHKFKDEFPEKLQEAGLLLNTLSTSILNDEIFRPLPRKSSACTYCELSKICVKSELS